MSEQIQPARASTSLRLALLHAPELGASTLTSYFNPFAHEDVIRFSSRILHAIAQKSQGA
jgi:hypothetical protein